MDYFIVLEKFFLLSEMALYDIEIFEEKSIAYQKKKGKIDTFRQSGSNVKNPFAIILFDISNEQILCIIKEQKISHVIKVQKIFNIAEFRAKNTINFVSSISYYQYNTILNEIKLRCQKLYAVCSQRQYQIRTLCC